MIASCLRRLSLAVSGGVVLAGGPAFAQSQTLLDTDIPFDLSNANRPTVLERPHPEIDPLGIRAGGFLVFPEVRFGAVFSSNALEVDTGAAADGFVEFAPKVEAQSQWSRHMLDLEASAELHQYFRSSIRNENAFDVRASGRLDIYGQSNLFSSVDVSRTYLEQYIGDVPGNAAGVIPLDRVIVLTRGTYDDNRLRLTGSASLTTLRYGQTTTLDGSVIDERFRDETALRGSGRLEYTIGESSAAFVQASYTRHDFTRVAGALDRTGDDTRVIGGIAFDITPLLRARIGVGYLVRNYSARDISSLKGLAFDGQITYLFSQLTTFGIEARREARDAITNNSPGYYSTTIRAQVDHEFLRNVILESELSYERDNFASIYRIDTIYQLGASVVYTPWRNLVISPQANYIKRLNKGDQIGPRFNEFRMTLEAIVRI